MRTRSGNTHGNQSWIEKTILSSFLFKLREASELDLEKLPFPKVQFGAAKRYSAAWKTRIKRKIAKRAKEGSSATGRKRRSGTSGVTRASRRRRNKNLNQPRR